MFHSLIASGKYEYQLHRLPCARYVSFPIGYNFTRQAENVEDNIILRLEPDSAGLGPKVRCGGTDREGRVE